MLLDYGAALEESLETSRTMNVFFFLLGGKRKTKKESRKAGRCNFQRKGIRRKSKRD